MANQTARESEGFDVRDDVDFKVADRAEGRRAAPAPAVLPASVSQRLLVYLLAVLSVLGLAAFLIQRNIVAGQRDTIRNQQTVINEQVGQLASIRNKNLQLQQEKNELVLQLRQAERKLADERKASDQRIKDLESELDRIKGQQGRSRNGG